MIKVNTEKCIGCGLCAADCVGRAIQVEDGVAVVKSECIQCGHCVAICPVNAVLIPDYDMDEVEEYNKDTFELNSENVLHAIKFRRSVRDYKKQKLTNDEIKMLSDAGRYTATAKNNQGCTFVFVQNELDYVKESVYNFIDENAKNVGKTLPKEFLTFVAFSRNKKKHGVDFLFRNAPAVLFVTSDWPLDAGLAAQNIETMAVSMGMGALYNGYLARLVEENKELKEWLGIEGKQIRACMLLGYPAKTYKRTAPRREANLIVK